MRHLFPVLMIGMSVLIANPAAMALDLSASTDLSAAKAKKKHRQYVHLRAAPQTTGYAPRPWMDPSIAPDGRPYRNPYPPGTCSVDEGYGRFSPCTFRD
jgi:hypothetical protein